MIDFALSETELLLYGAIFLATILLAEGLFLIFRDSRTAQRRAANRRARLHAKGMGTRKALYKLKRNRLSSRLDKRDGKAAPLSGALARLDRLLDESGLMISTGRFLLIVVLLGMTVLVALQLFLPIPLYLAVLLAIVCGASLPVLYVLRMRQVRLAKFAEQLPEAIDMIVRSLRAGHPIRTSFSLVAREMSDPTGTEFGILLDELTYGLDLDEALHNMEVRNDVPDLHYLVVTINLQSGTGGNLAEILSNLATVIRDRYRMFKKVRALSAEGRLSAYVIAGVPFFVVGIMWFNSPAYYLDAMGHPAFPVLIGIAVFLYFFSMFAIYRIVNFRV